MRLPFLRQDPTYGVLVVDDDEGIWAALRLCLAPRGAKVQGCATGDDARALVVATAPDIVFLDIGLVRESGLTILPDLLERRRQAAVVIITGAATLSLAVRAAKLGATEVIQKPFDPDDVRALVDGIRATQLARMPGPELVLPAGFEGKLSGVTATRSDVFKAFLETVQRIAAKDCDVLLGGPSGTGKTMIANVIHVLSPRRHKPFVVVNSPDLPDNLMTSLMFGHRRGAFTGADTQADGAVQAAEHGTLFFDEVGDLSPSIQPRFLVFWDSRRFCRLGETKEHKVDVRIVAATNRDLSADVASGRFREDLYHRINVVKLIVPTLQERREDVLPLAHTFLRAVAEKSGCPNLAFSAAAEEHIAAYHWPGNVRELRNVVTRAAAICEGDTIEPRHLMLDPAQAAVARTGGRRAKSSVTREELAAALRDAPTDVVAAAALGISERHLRRLKVLYELK